MSHDLVRVVHSKGKTQVFCSCGWHSPLKAYVDPEDVHALHVERQAPLDLVAYFAARRYA